MTVFDLLQPHKGLFDLDEVHCKSRVIAYDSQDGKVVFDTGKNKEKFYGKFMCCEILSIWADVKGIKGVAYGNYFAPVLCVSLHHVEVEKQRAVFE